jgi:hypothetical protein
MIEDYAQNFLYPLIWPFFSSYDYLFPLVAHANHKWNSGYILGRRTWPRRYGLFNFGDPVPNGDGSRGNIFYYDTRQYISVGFFITSEDLYGLPERSDSHKL